MEYLYYSPSSSYYYYDGSYSSDPSTAIGLFGLGIGLLIFLSMISLIVSILMIASMWKIFTKAGEKGWKAIIPIYNLVTLYKISNMSPWLVLVFLVAIIPILGWIVTVGMSIYQSIQLSKSFGKESGFTVGLVLLPVIFYPILAFGDSQYVGQWYTEDTYGPNYGPNGPQNYNNGYNANANGFVNQMPQNGMNNGMNNGFVNSNGQNPNIQNAGYQNNPNIQNANYGMPNQGYPSNVQNTGYVNQGQGFVNANMQGQVNNPQNQANPNMNAQAQGYQNVNVQQQGYPNGQVQNQENQMNQNQNNTNAQNNG